MKVKELIEKLKELDPETDVLREGEYGGYFEASFSHMENVKVEKKYHSDDSYVAASAIVF